MIYVFVFLGEFGYELLNWQGVVRKFAKRVDRRLNKIIVCSRKGLEPFYECADHYIDISELPYFKNSVASEYWGHNPEINYYKHREAVTAGQLPHEIFSPKDMACQEEIKREVRELVRRKLEPSSLGAVRRLRFVFSSDCQTLAGLTFGTPPWTPPNIYETLDVDNNEYVQIRPDETAVPLVESKLGFPLAEDYVLCQMGERSMIQRSKVTVDKGAIVRKFARDTKVVLLNFNTGRNMDSYSRFEGVENCHVYNCSSFREQSVLVAHAMACVFFTEGDFRSHNYVPPFMGKDVYAVADESVFQLPTTPIAFWNRNVFKFGGQIIPLTPEALLAIN